MTTQHLRSLYGDVWSKAGPPGLQTRVNASSLEIAKQCPRKYQYRIIKETGSPPRTGRYGIWNTRPQGAGTVRSIAAGGPGP